MDDACGEHRTIIDRFVWGSEPFELLIEAGCYILAKTVA
jgi:hypothetical protein